MNKQTIIFILAVFGYCSALFIGCVAEAQEGSDLFEHRSFIVVEEDGVEMEINYFVEIPSEDSPSSITNDTFNGIYGDPDVGESRHVGYTPAGERVVTWESNVDYVRAKGIYGTADQEHINDIFAPFYVVRVYGDGSRAELDTDGVVRVYGPKRVNTVTVSKTPVKNASFWNLVNTIDSLPTI